MIRLPIAATLLCASMAAAQTPAPPGADAALEPAEARARVLALADGRRWDADALDRLAAVPEQGVRVAVARLLGQLARPEAVERLAALTRDPAPAVRAAAVESAGRLCAVLGATEGCEKLASGVAARLSDVDPATRRAAGWAIGAAFPLLGAEVSGRLRSETDPGVRAAWLAELWRSEGDGWTGAAVAALGAATPAERRAAAWSLGRAQRAEGVAPLRRRVADPDALVRVAVLDAGRRIDAAAFVEPFGAALSDGDPRVRTAALLGLAAAGKALADPVRDAVAETVADRAFERAQERVAAIRAAGACGCCGEALRAAVASADPWAAGEALVALARQGAEGAGRTVGEWLASEDAERRRWAVRAARHLGEPAAILEAALSDPEARVRLAGVEASAALPDAARARLLSRVQRDGDPAVRAAGLEARSTAGSPPPVEIMVALVQRELGQAIPDAAVALVDALAAGESLAERAESALFDLLASGDPVVARAAWRALRSHGLAAPLPEVATGEDPGFYREVVAWAAEPRWLEIRTWRGTMTVVLDTDDAPLTAYRISRLAEEHYFDGLTFHRVEPDFVVQGGDPRGDGWGGPGFALRDELSLAPYDEGDVGMALAGPDTGGSQLFVTLTPQPHLVGRYPHVGRVAEGRDVADRLRVGDRILRVRAGSGAPPPVAATWYGPLEWERLRAAFPEYAENLGSYQPRADLLELLGSARLRYEVTVAMGTWCSDSRVLVPHLERVLAELGERSPFEPPRLLGIDRSKTTIGGQWPYGAIELVPTAVISVGGAEIGRIVETPSSESVEEDLVRILAPIEGFTLPE